MPSVDSERGAALDAALRLWNARAGSVYQDARPVLRDAQDRLDQVLAHLDQRRPLERDQVLESVGDAAAGHRRLEALEDALAAYHVELQTLLIQADRALAAGRALAQVLNTLQDAGADPIPDPAIGDGAAGDREAALRAEIDALKRELDTTRAALQATQAAPRALSAEAQRELVRLRGEVEELRESKAAFADPTPLPALDAHSRLRAEAVDESGHRRPLGLILVKAGVITHVQLDDALREQRSAWNRHLGALLVDLGYVSEEVIAQTLAAQVRVPYLHIHADRLDRTVTRLVNPQMAQHHTCVPVRLDGQRLVVAMANPLDLIAQEDLRLATGLEIEVHVATATAIKNAIRRVYDLR